MLPKGKRNTLHIAVPAFCRAGATVSKTLIQKDYLSYNKDVISNISSLPKWRQHSTVDAPGEQRTVHSASRKKTTVANRHEEMCLRQEGQSHSRLGGMSPGVLPHRGRHTELVGSFNSTVLGKKTLTVIIKENKCLRDQCVRQECTRNILL